MTSNQVVGRWYFNDLLGYKGKLPSSTFGLFYMKCLMDIVAADGVISDDERNWVVGYAAVSGYSDEVIDAVKKYEPTSRKEGVEVLKTNLDKDYVKLNRLSLVYNALRAAGADGNIHEKELQAITAFAKNLGVKQDEIEKVQALYESDIKLRKKRAAVLVPKSLDKVLTELKKA